MAQKDAVLVTYLKDILFSKEEIEAAVEVREHIFEMKDETGSVGYISLYDLKTYVFEHDQEAGDYQVRSIDGKEWTPVFEHPFFQRRKPQLISANTLSSEDDQQFFILRHGQKTGPYEKYELVNMLEDKDLLLTDMVSGNAGHTWMRLYQVDGFDRRVLKESDQLPGIPSSVINQGNESVVELSPETEAISSLAYLSNVKRGKSIERERMEFRDTAVTTAGSQSSIYKWLLVASVLGIGYFLFHIKNQLSSPFKGEAVSSVGEQAQMLTPVEMTEPGAPGATNNSGRAQVGERKHFNQVNDQGRSPGGKFESRNLNPIRPNQRKSFMETGKYQEIKNNAGGEEDPNYFYDNTSAMELDPVRSQVSKENFDNSQAESEGPIPASDNLFESEVQN